MRVSLPKDRPCLGVGKKITLIVEYFGKRTVVLLEVHDG